MALKLNTSRQLLVYADDVNTLGGNVHTIMEKAEAFVVASKEVVLEVSADKTKHIVMSRDQNARRSHNMLFIDFKKSYESLRRGVLYNINTETGVPMNNANKNVSETHSNVRVGKHLFDMFPIRNRLKQRNALSSLFFTFA
jgi:hypothetical protein